MKKQKDKNKELNFEILAFVIMILLVILCTIQSVILHNYKDMIELQKELSDSEFTEGITIDSTNSEWSKICFWQNTSEPLPKDIVLIKR